MGVPDDEAAQYETDFKSGRTLVTVRSTDRVGEAWSIIQKHGGTTRSDMSGFSRANRAEVRV